MHPLQLVTTFVCCCLILPFAVLANDSDGDGISDSIEIVSGADPFSRNMVSLGEANNCVLDEEAVKCWGYDNPNATSVNDVPLLQNPKWITTGFLHACAIDDHGVMCWGRGDFNQLQIPPMQNPSFIDAKFTVTCALDKSSSSEVKCWGVQPFEFQGTRKPPQVPELVNPIQVSVGQKVACALDDNGVKCWQTSQSYYDYNMSLPEYESWEGRTFGVVFREDTWVEAVDTLLSVPNLENPRAITVGDSEACAIDDTGLVCWGSGARIIFDAKRGKTAVPAEILRPFIGQPSAVALGSWLGCAVENDLLKCWPNNYDIDFSDTTGSEFALSGTRAIASGSGRVCAIDNTGFSCKVADSEQYLADAFSRWGIAAAPASFDLKFFSPDSDDDGSLDDSDNCPSTPNPDQADLDGDNIGDACDTDVDGDSVEDSLDNCPLVANSDQLDVDGDLIGDACDDLIDNDADGIANDLDNCPAVPNADQADNDGDLQGDACDLDDDNDGVEDTLDNCSLTANEDQADNDSDNIGDVCDSDDDNDAIEDDLDNCPLIANVSQDDNDGDGFGDVCDPDDDNDAVNDSVDNCPLSFNPDQSNTDGVGAGDACNDAFDVDDDDWENDYDNCPDVANRNQSDFDYDNIGDACDSDVDGDEVVNAGDACELTPLGELVGSIGCSIEQLCPCDAPRQSTDPWKNHGQYVSCMTKAAQSFAADGVISDNEKSDLVNAAAQSSCGY